MTPSIAEKAIKDGLATLKKATAPWSPDVQDAFGKIEAAGKSILTANAKKTPSGASMTDDLRHAFVPLYEHFTGEALQLAAAIFTMCVKQRAVLARSKGEMESAERWESVAAAVLDGVLDYHDKDESSATKAAISRAFYKNVASNFFASGSSSAAFSITLRQNVYTLLCYTATHHADNQETLRGLISPQRFGQVIYACKDSLPQDELLNTLGVVLPRVLRGPPENRPRAFQMLRECFDQDGAHPAGEDIIRHVENKLANTTDWTETVEEIGGLLAHDISFPQPFKHTLFQAGGLEDPPKRVQPRFFVDRQSFVFYNEAEEGTYDTFIVGFNTVAHTSVSKTGLVTAQLTAPPGGGPRGALARRPSGTVPLSLMFKVETGRAEHLYDTLVERKLKSVVWKDMTLTKTRKQFSISQEPARLDFVDGRNAYEPSTSEKARLVAEGVDKTSEPGDEQPIGDELAFASEAIPSAPSRAQPEAKQPRTQHPLPSLTDKLTQVTSPSSTPVPAAPAPEPAVSPGPYIESPPPGSPAKPAPTRLPSFSSKFTDILTKANSAVSKPSSSNPKASSASSKPHAAASTKPKSTATQLPKKPSIANEEWYNASSQEQIAQGIDDMLGTSESTSELSNLSDDDSIPEAARMRARKAQEKEKSVKGGKKADMHATGSNDVVLPVSSTRKRKAAKISEHGGSPLERRRSPRLSQATPAAEDAPVAEPAPVASPPRFPSLVAQDVVAPAAPSKPHPRPKGKAAVAAAKNGEDENDPPAPAKKTAKTDKKAADALASATDSSPPGPSKKTPAQTKPTDETTEAPAAPKKKVRPPPPPVEPDVEPRARPTRASAAAASKKIAHDAGVLNEPTQESESSPNGGAHGSSSTAVEGHRGRSVASASAEPQPKPDKPPAAKRKTKAQDPSSSPPAAASATRGKRKRDEDPQPAFEASTSRAAKRQRGDPKTPAAPPQPKTKAPPARPAKPAARKYGAHGTGKDKKSFPEANFDVIPGSSPKSPLEELLAQTRGLRSSSPAPLTVAGPSRVEAMRGKGANTKKDVKATEATIENSGGKREVKRLPRGVAAQRAPHHSPAVESERTGDIESIAPASTPASRVDPAPTANVPPSEISRSSAQPSHDGAYDDVNMFDEPQTEPAVPAPTAKPSTKPTRRSAPIHPVAPEFDFGETSPEPEKTATSAPTTSIGRTTKHVAVEDVDVAEFFEGEPVSAQTSTARRRTSVKRTSGKDTTMNDATLYDDVDMLDATIAISPPRLSAAAKGKARLSSPIIEAATDVVDTFEVDFDFDSAEPQDQVSDSAKEDAKASDKSSSSSSYHEKYTDITLPLRGERDHSAPPFDVYMSCEDVSLPSFDEEPEERAVRGKKSVAFAEAGPEIHQKPAPTAFVQEKPAAAPRASTSSNQLSPIRIDQVGLSQERSRLFQPKTAKVVAQAQPRRSGPPRRVPMKARAPAVVEEKREEQEPKDRVLDILDEIHSIVKNKIRTGFDGVDQRVVNMRKRFLRQAADDIRAQLPDYIATYNELLALHEAYSAFAVRKQAAISHAEQLANEGVRQVKEIIRAHDIRANEMARNRPVMPPLPHSVAKWLT